MTAANMRYFMNSSASLTRPAPTWGVAIADRARHAPVVLREAEPHQFETLRSTAIDLLVVAVKFLLPFTVSRFQAALDTADNLRRRSVSQTAGAAAGKLPAMPSPPVDEEQDVSAFLLDHWLEGLDQLRRKKSRAPRDFEQSEGKEAVQAFGVPGRKKRPFRIAGG